MEKNSFMKKIKIGNKIISDDKPVFIIAEAGVNHNGSIKNGKNAYCDFFLKKYYN